MMRFLLGGGWLLWLGFLGASPAAPVDQEKRSKSEAFPGGGVLRSGAEPVAFVPSTSAGIEAIDPRTGKILWATKAAQKPLRVIDSRIFCQANVEGKANAVKIVAFDIPTGKISIESTPLMFPEWASVRVQHGRTFFAATQVQKEGLLYIWQANAFYAGGAPPTPEIEEAARKSARGAYLLTLDTGKASTVKDSAIIDKAVLDSGDVAECRVGELTIRTENRPGKNKGNPFQQSRFLKATSANGKVLWEHEIAAPVFLPPLP